MCLVLISYRQHPGYRLILAANRDEFYDRPSQSASYWGGEPLILGGKDLKAGGTWFGMTQTGRFAVLTNFREPGSYMPDAPSRGNLVRDFLRGPEDPSEFLNDLKGEARRYNGFSLIAGDFDRLHYFSNRSSGPGELPPGDYGLSNNLLDKPWPKVELGKKLLRSIVDRGPFSSEDLFNILGNRERPQDERLPDTGVGLEWERILSAIFIASPVYGTRCSTIVLIENSGKIAFIERAFNTRAEPCITSEFHFRINRNGD